MRAAFGCCNLLCPVVTCFVLYSLLLERPSQGLYAGPGSCTGLTENQDGQWLADTAAVDAAQGSIQTLVDCVPDGGSLLLTVDILELSEALVLNRPVSIGAAGEPGLRPSILVTCPEAGPALEIGYPGVGVSNLLFSGCSLNGPSIIDVLSGGNLTLTDTKFENNSNAAGPGCISASSASVSLQNCSFLSNTGIDGGSIGIAKDSSLSIVASVFQTNSAEKGGALMASNSSVQIRDSVFESNEGQNAGGAIHVEGSSSSLVLTETSFGNNTAIIGGAISSWNGSDTTLSATILYNNTASELGGGVAVLSLSEPASLTVSESVFENNTGQGMGGAISFDALDSDLLIDSGTRFTENRATGGGAVAVLGTPGPVTVTVKGAVFNGNRATNGAGALNLVGVVTSILEGTTFEKNWGQKGAAVYAFDNGDLTASNCTFLSNHARQSGGAVNFEHNDLTRPGVQGASDEVILMDECVFVNNTAGEVVSGELGPAVVSLTGSGGAIAIQGGGTNVTLQRSLVDNNTAILGGGISWQHGGVLLVEDSEIIWNQAVLGGGVRVQTLDGISESLVMNRVTVMGNTAQRGGGLCMSAMEVPFMTLANLEFKGARVAEFTEVEVSKNTVSDRGGGVDLEEMLLKCHKCKIALNSAGLGDPGFGALEQGGGIMVGKNSMVELTASTLKSNSADNGGGIFVDTGGVTATDTTFVNNTAEHLGGAVALNYGASVTTPSAVLMNCTSCEMSKNKGRIGGAIHLVVTRPWPEFKKCDDLKQFQTDPRVTQQEILDLSPACSALPSFPQLLNNRHILLESSVFSNNQATEAGAGIFANDVKHVEVCCNGQCSFGNEWSEDVVCLDAKDGQGSSNRVTGDHPQSVVSSIFSQVELKPNKIDKHGSGKLLMPVEVILRDALGQVVSGQQVMLTVKADDPNMISGNPTTGVLLDQGRSTVSGIIVRAEPGNYTLEFVLELEGAITHSMTEKLEVEVRECWIGEIYEENSKKCLPCDEQTFSFDPKGRCLPCPDHSNCNISTLTPNDGFWHATSQSVQLPNCLSKAACSFDGRQLALWNASFLAHRGGQVLPWEQGDYQQCAMGYTGPLCGSCEETYGRVGTTECGKCRSKGVAVFLMLLEFIILLAQVAYLTKEAVQYGRPVQPSDGGSDPVPSTSSSQLPEEVEAAYAREAQSAQRIEDVSGEKKTEADGQAEKACLEPNKTVEMLKILINFLQVIGTAAAINAQWTKSVASILALSDYVSGVSSGSAWLSYECAFEPGGIARSIKSYLFQALSPFTIWIILALFWIIRKLQGKLDMRQLKQRFIVGLLVLLYIIYINLSKKIIQMYNCVSVDVSTDPAIQADTSLWAEDTYVECYRNSHALLMAVVGSPILLLVVFGYPVGLTVKLQRNKDKVNDPDFVGRYGFLYKAYKGSTSYWEAIVLMRKALIATIIVFSERLGPEQQGTLAVAVLVVALLLHNHFKPYDDSISELNTLESFSITVCLFVFLSGVIFIQNQDVDEVKVVLSVLLIVAVLIYMGFFFFFLARAVFEVFEKWLEAKDLGPTGQVKTDAGIAAKYVREVGQETVQKVREKLPWVRAPNKTESKV